MRPNTINDFWKKVDKNGPEVSDKADGKCWVWAGTDIRRGYPRLAARGRYWSAHRYSWFIHNGEIPVGTQVLHRCDNKVCVNPDHLFLGTSADNRRDCVQKERQARGEHHGRSKLTEESVREIRSRFVSGCRVNGARALAMEFGVLPFVIRKVVNRQNWGHVV